MNSDVELKDAAVAFFKVTLYRCCYLSSIDSDNLLKNTNPADIFEEILKVGHYYLREYDSLYSYKGKKITKLSYILCKAIMHVHPFEVDKDKVTEIEGIDSEIGFASQRYCFHLLREFYMMTFKADDDWRSTKLCIQLSEWHLRHHEKLFALIVSHKNVSNITDSFIRVILEIMGETHRVITSELTYCLLNRIGFNQTIRYWAEKKRTIGFIMFDLDNFKQINDSPIGGHDAGDICLQNVADKLMEIYKDEKYDCVISRNGGDEFLIAIADTDEDTVEEVAKKINELLHTIERKFAVNEEKNGIRDYISASIGGCLLTDTSLLAFESDDNGDSDKFAKALRAIITQIDKAHYDVKQSGRDNYKIVTLDNAPLKAIS